MTEHPCADCNEDVSLRDWRANKMRALVAGAPADLLDQLHWRCRECLRRVLHEELER